MEFDLGVQWRAMQLQDSEHLRALLQVGACLRETLFMQYSLHTIQFILPLLLLSQYSFPLVRALHYFFPLMPCLGW